MSAPPDDQELLPLFATVEPERVVGQSIEERFEAFHAANPHVADALELLATRWLEHNTRLSVKALVERLRWEAGTRTETAGSYRINNSHTAFYARLLLDRHPDWEPAIETRVQRAVA